MLVAALLLAAAAGAAPIFRDGPRPPPAFVVVSPALVDDPARGLQWQRCPWGQRGEHCTEGTPRRLSAMQAQDLVARLARDGWSGRHDWRLPTRAELRTLVDGHCVDPAIDGRVFPATPPLWFWSADTEPGNDYDAWAVDFRSGDEVLDDRNLPNAVRLVRRREAAAQ